MPFVDRMAQPVPWPRLEAAPIIEVMCGVVFQTLPDIDPIFVGGFQRDVEHDYPKHAIHPPVAEGSALIFTSGGVGPLRSWLISATEEWVLQLQPDRFYVNWRRRGQEYPRFSGSHGVLERAMFEFTRFRAHCNAKLGKDIVPAMVELAKVDLIQEGVPWRDVDDLGGIIPVVADVARFASSPAVELGLHIADRDAAGISMAMNLSLGTETLFDGRPARAARIETKCTAGLSGVDDATVRAGLVSLNARANAAFFGLIKDTAVDRFKNEPGGSEEKG